MNAVQTPALGTLRFVTGPLAGSLYQITKPSISIGRDPNNDIVIPDPGISRRHAQLEWNNGVWLITKVAAQNQLFINQIDMQQAFLHDQDVVGLGTTTACVFQAPLGGFVQQPFSSPALQPPPPQYSPPRSPVQQPYPAAPHKATVAAPPHNQGAFVPQGDVKGTQRAPEAGSYDAAGGASLAYGAGISGTPTLEVSTNTDRERQLYPLNKQVINIGRDPSNDIVINRPTVSGFHGQIVREGQQLVFIHPHPARGKTVNGIIYQGRVIAGNEPFRKVLARGDVFRISDEHGTLVTLTYNDGSGAAQDIIPEIRPIPLGAAVITIGRAPDNMVVLNHPQVSGHHARLEMAQGGYRILDLGSTNHVYVNAERVAQRLLQPGDEIRIGPFKLTYTGTELAQQDESGGIRIDALHLKKTGNKGVVILNDISLAIPPRKFVAIVGGSGAGKSTLMDALNGLRPAQEGTVLYNGQDYYTHLAAFSTQLGYVPQDDIIHRDLSAQRALYYAAKMRLPEDYSEQQIRERVNEVLEDVEMKHRQDLLVSKLSGGQRKRVSIALELLAKPSVFFLDEPTSGLDPGLDRKMMLLLRKLADRGRTIILVTHATNNINVCDYVCFLCQGGRLAYYGPPGDALTYFGKTDFAEIYSALEPTEENRNIPAEAEMRFQQSRDYQIYVATPLSQGPAGRAAFTTAQSIKPAKRGNPWKQFSVLAARYLELLKNDTGNLSILLLQAPVIGLILLFMLLSNNGRGTFDPTSIARCTGSVTIAGQMTVYHNCSELQSDLNTPQGQQYAQEHGGADHVIQLAIAQGLGGGDAQKILLIMAFAAVMFGCINGAREIVKEAPIYRRERAVNLGIAPYMFSKIVILGMLCLVQSAIIVLLVNLVARFQQGIVLPPLVEIYITMALTSLAGLMLGLTVSALSPNNDRAMSFVPIVLIPQIIFSGVTFPLKGALLQVLGAFFPARWAMAGMGSTIGLHGDSLGSDDFSYHGTLLSTYSQAQAGLHLFFVWFMLLLTIILLGFAIAYFLKRKDIRA